MRQPIQGERECARGSKCECMFIDPKCPFICVEFLTMQELSDRPDDNQLCVICSRCVCVCVLLVCQCMIPSNRRKETQYLFYDMTFNGKVYNSVIQRFGNMYGNGEYAQSCLLVSNKAQHMPCMPKPIMSHQRNRYVVHRNSSGLLCLRQTRYALFTPDSCSTC